MLKQKRQQSMSLHKGHPTFLFSIDGDYDDDDAELCKEGMQCDSDAADDYEEDDEQPEHLSNSDIHMENPDDLDKAITPRDIIVEDGTFMSNPQNILNYE
jgi:PHP family Zn ribbon phosphoesterase